MQTTIQSILCDFPTKTYCEDININYTSYYLIDELLTILKMKNKVMIQFSWILILGTFYIGGTDALTYSNYTSLVTNVLTNYNSDIIPLADHSNTLNVTVTGYLYSLLDVDVVVGTLSLVFALEASWSDSQITWTPADYGNLASISLPAKQVWTPNFVLGTPVDFTTIGESWQPVTFQNNGDAIVTFGDVINSACTFDLKFWPFDKHTCDVSIIAYGYSETQLQLISSGNFILIDGADNIEWVITKTSTFLKNGQTSSEVIFRVEIERRSQIFVILIVFPLYALACLNSFVLLLPTESGERIGFSTTLLLSIAVFLETVSGYIPNTSKPIPMLCIVVTLGMTMALLCTLTVIISMYYYFKPEEEPIHRYYIRFVKFFNKKFRSPKIATQNDGMSNRGLSIVDDVSVGHDLPVLKDKPQQDSESDAEITWKDVSYTIDKVMFISSTMGHMMLLIIFTFYINIAN